MTKIMEAEVEIKMNTEGGQVGDRSTGEVTEITKKTGGIGGAMFL